jgi:methionine synthase II (cobalamin-independent)
MPPPFRAEQIGSLMRPPELLAARSAAGATTSYSKISDELHRATEVAIGQAVNKQVELGMTYHVRRI